MPSSIQRAGLVAGHRAAQTSTHRNSVAQIMKFVQTQSSDRNSAAAHPLRPARGERQRRERFSDRSRKYDTVGDDRIDDCVDGLRVHRRKRSGKAQRRLQDDAGYVAILGRDPVPARFRPSASANTDAASSVDLPLTVMDLRFADSTMRNSPSPLRSSRVWAHCAHDG
jgi:hypothetical protein